MIDNIDFGDVDALSYDGLWPRSLVPRKTSLAGGHLLSRIVILPAQLFATTMSSFPSPLRSVGTRY